MSGRNELEANPQAVQVAAMQSTANGRVRSRVRRSRVASAPIDPLIIALGAAIMCYVWRVQDLYYIFGTIRAPILASAAMLGLYLVDQDRRRLLVNAWHPISRYVLIILGLAILSVPTSVYQGMSFSFIIDDFAKNVLIFAILIAAVRCFEDVRRLTAVVVIGAAIYAQFVYFKVPIGAEGRLGNIVYYDANDIGMLLVCTIPLCLFFLLRGRNAVVKAAAAVSLALFVLVIIKSGSRGAFLSLIAVGLYFLFFLSTVKRSVRIGAVAGSVLIMVFIGGDQYWEMMSTMLNPKDDYNWSGNSDTGRMDVWKRGIGYMMDRPFTGVGASAFGVAEGTISPIADRQMFGIGLKWSAAHNSFVQIGAELGVGGLLAFVLLIGTAYRTARRTSGATWKRGKVTDEDLLGQALAGSIVAYIVAGFFLSQAYSAYMLILYALIAGLDRMRVPAGRPVRRTGRRVRSVPLTSPLPTVAPGPG